MKGIVGRPFPKGVSGNPGVRPKELREVIELARAHGPEAIAVLADIMNDPESPPAARVAAANALLDRGWGKPAQAVELFGNAGGPIETADVTSARDIIEGRLAEVAARLRPPAEPPSLMDAGKPAERNS
jgi:hypothetical protein